MGIREVIQKHQMTIILVGAVIVIVTMLPAAINAVKGLLAKARGK